MTNSVKIRIVKAILKNYQTNNIISRTQETLMEKVVASNKNITALLAMLKFNQIKYTQLSSVNVVHVTKDKMQKIR